jgi:hypothetical protein
VKTRILYNGVKYRAQYKLWWWPFWLNCKDYNDTNDDTLRQTTRYYLTYEEAERRAREEIHKELSSKWMVVEKQSKGD